LFFELYLSMKFRGQLFLLLSIFSLLESCSLVNSLNGFSGRKYREGIYHSKKERPLVSKKESGKQEQAEASEQADSVGNVQQDDSETATASIDSVIVPIESNQYKKLFVPQLQKATSVLKTLPLISRKRHFLKTGEEEPEMDWTGLVSFICGVLGLAIIIAILALAFSNFSAFFSAAAFVIYLMAIALSVCAIVFGSINHSHNKNNPDKYPDWYFGMIGHITGIVGLAMELAAGIICLLVILLLAALFI